jgi:hypothetical protein
LRAYTIDGSGISPQGSISLSYANHVSKYFYIAKVTDSGTLRLLYPSQDDAMATVALPFGSLTTSLCSFGPPSVIEPYDQALTILVSVYGTLNLILIASVTIFVIIFRNSSAIKGFSAEFCVLILIALACGAIAGILFAIAPTSDNNICTSRLWLVSLSSTSIFALLFAKTWRLAQIFFSHSVMVIPHLTNLVVVVFTVV